MTFLNDLKNKSKEIALLYAVIFIPMWCIFLINNVVLSDALNYFGGIHPRDVSFLGILEIFTSWMFHHGSSHEVGHSIFTHIVGNSQVLLALLLIVGIFEKRPLLLIFFLIFASGLATWLLGAPNSIHVGASGLVFSLFGYIIASIFLARRWFYIIPILATGSSYIYSIQAGLIPQEGTSFAAHFGGLIGGIVVAYFIGKAQHYRELSSQNNFNTTSKKDIFIQKVKNFFTFKPN